jgi:SSS family solute:Na+ symporter
MLWIGTLFILAGQLLALAFVLEAVAGWPRWVGCLTGGLVMTIYFTAGGMLSTIWVNLVQLAVLLVGFALACRSRSRRWVAGRACARRPTAAGPTGASGAAAAPAGSSWPCSGPRSSCRRACCRRSTARRTIAPSASACWPTAAVLFVFAFLPVLLGMIARGLHPGLADRELALPLLLVHDLPLAIGSLGLAALVAAEVSTADAILFMLSTSPHAISTSASCARLPPTPTCCGWRGSPRSWPASPGVVIASLVTKAVTDALGFFYTLLSVSLFVPIAAACSGARLGAPQAWAPSRRRARRRGGHSSFPGALAPGRDAGDGRNRGRSVDGGHGRR